jgi:post-segregation antitoxin (ccd killing protein)
MQMGTKGNVVLYLDKELVSKSKEIGFNLSKTFENYLKIPNNTILNKQFTKQLQFSNKNDKWWAEPGLPPNQTV